MPFYTANRAFLQARPTGLEPATTGSTVRYSNQLSYGPQLEHVILAWLSGLASPCGALANWFYVDGSAVIAVVRKLPLNWRMTTFLPTGATARIRELGLQQARVRHAWCSRACSVFVRKVFVEMGDKMSSFSRYFDLLIRQINQMERVHWIGLSIVVLVVGIFCMRSMNTRM